jgi:hypothetical protein
LLVSILLFHQPPISTATPTTDFDDALALAHATHLAGAIGPRLAGSAGEQQAAAWLATQFTNLGYAVTIEPFVYSRWGEPVVGMNVVAIQAGQPAYGTLYVGAHYDTAPPPFAGPGANDNASGIGVLLAAATLLAGQPLTPTLTFIAFDAEEDFLTGSTHYVAQLTAVERLSAIGMLNLDCVGIGDTLYLNVLRTDQLAFAQTLGVTADAIHYDPQANSDHAPFAWAGISAVYFDMHDVGGHACGPDYHSPGDTADKLELAALQRAGSALVTAIETLSNQAAPRPVWQLYLPLIRARP